LHRLLYGHSAPQEALELVAARVTVQGVVEKGRPVGSAQSPGAGARRAAAPYSRRRVYIGEQGFIDTPVYRRAELAAGAQLEGPAIVEEAASTTVLLAQDRLQVVPTGELIIEIGEEEA